MSATNYNNVDWTSFAPEQKACDPSWEICEESKSSNQPATSSQAGANSTADGSANSSVDASVKTSANTMVWGILSASNLMAGYLMYNNYNNFATSLTAASSTTATQTQNWTASWVKTQKPLQMWFYTSYAVMGTQTISVLAWVLQQAFGMDELFLKMFKVGMVYPLIELAMIGYTYLAYPSCSSTTAANWSGDTSSSDTQYVSCSGWTSGTSYIPSEVASDARNTYAGAGATGAALLTFVNMMSNSKFADAFSVAGAPESQSAAEVNDEQDPEEAEEDETAAPADNYSSKPASQPAKQSTEKSDSQSSSSQNAAKPADPEPAPKPEPQPEPEPQPQTWNSGNSWGSGWIL